MIYLDNSATTPLLPEVRSAMEPFLTGEFGNASSVHSLGLHARVALEEARESVARAINAEPREIIFTSGGTESDNAAIAGAVFRHHLRGMAFRDIHLITSPAEHLAVLDAARFVQKLGAELSLTQAGTHGGVATGALAELLRERTALISLMMVNNETGAISPIRDLADYAREHSQAMFHADAVQALGKLPINVRELGVDMLTMSAHKIHGPKGIGALYVRAGREIEPLLHGGSQERNRRGGTEAVALAVGFAEAVRQMQVSDERVRALRALLQSELVAIPEVRFNSPLDDTCVPNILNISFVSEVLSRLDPEALLIRFDMAGIAVSNGAACSSGSMQASHVLLACGRGEEIARKSVRVSLSRFNSADDIERFVQTLRTIIA